LLIRLDIGPVLSEGLSFACVPGRSWGTGFEVGVLFLWCMGFAARGLTSIAAFVAPSSIHGRVIAFCYGHYLVPGSFWSELGLNIAA